MKKSKMSLKTNVYVQYQDILPIYSLPDTNTCITFSAFSHFQIMYFSCINESLFTHAFPQHQYLGYSYINHKLVHITILSGKSLVHVNKNYAQLITAYSFIWLVWRLKRGWRTFSLEINSLHLNKTQVKSTR